jgi:hypothetical protein
VRNQSRQLGDVDGDAPRFVAREQAGGFAPGVSCWGERFN